MSTLVDLDGYLRRIGLDGPAPLAEVHRAHATSVVFENFEPYSGRPVVLDLGQLERKIVRHHRGGYCFEQNLLLAGHCGPWDSRSSRCSPGCAAAPKARTTRSTTSCSGWSRTGRRGWPTSGSAAAAFEAGAESDQSGWRYRLARDGRELVLQVFEDGDWADNDGFVPEAVPHVDIEVANWFTATRPDSIFVTSVFVGMRCVDRCLTALVGDQGVLIERPVHGASSTTEVVVDDLPSLLAERFMLRGVRLDAGGRLEMDPPD